MININIQQTYLSFLYLVGDFFFSLFYFCFIIVFLAVGFSLSIFWLGIPLIIFLFQIVEKMTQKEKNFSSNLLPVEYTKIKFNSYQEEGLLKKYKLLVTDKKIWKYIVYHLLKFPLAVFSFSIGMFLFLLPISLITAPLIYNFVPYNFLFLEVKSLFLALLLSVLGIGLSFIFFPLLNKIALKQASFIKNS